MRKPRATNKQIDKAVARLSFYEWTDIEISELTRRLTKQKPMKPYVEMAYQILSEADIANQRRIETIVKRIEEDFGEKRQALISLN